MKRTLERISLAVFCTAAVSACSNASGGSFGPPAADQAPAHKTTQSQTFAYTGGKQTFTVPYGVTSLTVTASCASGESTAAIRTAADRTAAAVAGGGSTYGSYGSYGGGDGGGGGGGSSYVELGARHVEDHGGAAASGNGQIVVTWKS